MNHQPAPDQDDQGDGDADGEHQGGVECRVDFGVTDIAAHVLFVFLAKLLDLVFLPGKPFDDGGAGDVLLRPGAEGSQLRLDPLEAAVDCLAEVVHQQGNDREGQQGEKGQPRADGEHHGNHEEKRQDGVGGIGNPRP